MVEKKNSAIVEYYIAVNNIPLIIFHNILDQQYCDHEAILVLAGNTRYARRGAMQ